MHKNPLPRALLINQRGTADELTKAEVKTDLGAERGPVTISFTTLIRKKRESLAWRESRRELTYRRKASRFLRGPQDCHETEALGALLRRMTAHGLVRNSA